MCRGIVGDDEVINNCRLFERLFKVNKNSLFLSGISFFALEIFTFLYYAVVAKTEFIHTPTIEINLNSPIHLVSTSELIENDSLNRKITQAINNQ